MNSLAQACSPARAVVFLIGVKSRNPENPDSGKMVGLPLW
jgi:hypothetical protein